MVRIVDLDGIMEDVSRLQTKLNGVEEQATIKTTPPPESFLEHILNALLLNETK